MNDENNDFSPAEVGKPQPRGGRPRGNPPAAHRFQPGQSGNPAGRGGKRYSLLEWLSELADSTADELREIVADKKTPVNKLSAAVGWLRAVESQNWQSAHSELHALLNRFYGRATQNIHVQHDGLAMTQKLSIAILQQLPAGPMMRDELIGKICAILESGGDDSLPKLSPALRAPERE